VIDVHARFSYTAAPGSTDDARTRHLTLALPPRTPHASSRPRRPASPRTSCARPRPRPWARSTSATTAAAPTASRWNSPTSSTSSSSCRPGPRTGPQETRNAAAHTPLTTPTTGWPGSRRTAAAE
jgi:hypothetical protein